MRSSAALAPPLLLLLLLGLAQPGAAADFWKRHFGVDPTDLLRHVEHGFQTMEQSAQSEAHALEHALRGSLQGWLGPPAPAAAPASSAAASSEERIEDDDVESGFPDGFFGMFGPAREPWWKGPNVCVEREEIDESTRSRNTTDGDEDDDGHSIFGSFHFSSCQQTPISYVCRTKMNSHGIQKTFVVKYQCCYGHQRVEGKPGCVEVHMKPLMETLEDVGARDFVELIRSSGLDEKVRESNLTVFAPSDDALRDFTDSFQEANQVEFYSVNQRNKRDTNDKGENLSIRNILLGHMTQGFYDMNEIGNKNEVFTENNNSSIRMSVYPSPGERIITANCARVTSINNYATNGIVHVVDRVLQPVTQSLAQLIAQDEQFTTLELMLSKAGLLKQLAEPGHWTLFAFTDSAFQKLDTSVRKRLMDAEMCIKNVVRHHLVPHALCSAPILTRATTLNLDGEPLSLERRSADGKLFVNNVQIVAKDIMATNGIIQVVDAVLMPDSGQQLSHVLDTHNLTTFRALLDEAGLTEVLDSTNNVTLFVPSERALANPDAMAELERRRSNPTALRDLLLFHSTGPAVQGCDLGTSEKELKSGLADHSLHLGFYSSWPFLSSASPGRATVECARITRFDSRACGGVVHEVDRLLVPPKHSMLDTLKHLGNYSTFLRLIENANLQSELAQNAPLTILAPSDSVFDRLDPADMELLNNDTQLAAQIVRHHILPEMLCCAGVGGSSWLFVNRMETLDGQFVAVRRDHNDNVHIGSTSVNQCDIMATDGIIHSVNRIMVPTRRKNNRNRNPNVDVFLYGL